MFQRNLLRGLMSKRVALMGPGLVWLMLFLGVPCLLILSNSFFERGTYGGIDHVLTLENYTRGFDSLYVTIALDSMAIAGITTAIALLLGYPAAMAIVRCSPRRQMVALFLVMLPFWTNYLVRTYAWIVLLNREGLVNSALLQIGLIDNPLQLLYNRFAIVVGLVYAYLPFMILSLYTSLARVDVHLREASADLGASALTTFRRVTLPLTVPGVVTGSIFVFVLSLGNFLTPDLLGGKREMMLGNLIYQQFMTARDWPFGSAIAFILIGTMMLLLMLQAGWAGRRLRLQAEL